MALPRTLVALRRQILDGTLTVADALAAQADRVAHDTWNCVVHAFGPNDAGAMPEQALAGIGLTHKDMFVMPGRQPVCGARTVPQFDVPVSPLIQRLDNAGGVTLATLTMAEYASGVTGENANLPLPVNPLDSSYAVGGSSSGSAVSVAAGLSYGSLGTDTAGSVRIPAATCGVFGLKPTHGTLESQGCFPLAPTLDTVGVLTRSALDAAVLFAVLMNPECRAARLPRFVDVVENQGGIANADHLPMESWRLATIVDHHSPHFSANPETREAITTLAADFSDGPARHHKGLEGASDMVKRVNTLLHVEAAATHYSRLQAEGSELSAITRGVALPGAAIPAVWYYAAWQSRDVWRQKFLDTYLCDSDVVLTPVLPRGIPTWDHVQTTSANFDPAALLAMFSWTAFVNYLGLPAVSFPVGYGADGAPISVQAIGRPNCEATLLALAYQVELRRFGSDGFVTHSSKSRLRES